MHKLVILIEALDDSYQLDEKWPQFLQLAEDMPDLKREATIRVNTLLYGDWNVGMIHELYFDSLEELRKAMSSPQGQAAGQILQQITGGRVTLLIADHKEDTIENLRRHKGAAGEILELTPEDLQAYMQAHEIQGEILQMDAPTPTVTTAAQAVGASPEQIVKTLLFIVDDKEGVLAITCGTVTVDRRVIAGLYDVGRKKVSLASPEKVLEMTGYPVGTVPPFGLHQSLRALMDPRVLEHEQVYAGGGSKRTLVRTSPEDILRAAQAEIMDLHTPPSED
ncbi:MAG: EthD family reductase [Anaerolineales bacterium]|jgi:Cys-tRNA(Pro) deacylase